MSDTARALVYVNPGVAELRDVSLAPLPDGWVEVETIATALSRGTERLVYQGLVPSSEFQRMRAPFQSGEFPFPVKYGYCAVGRVTHGPEALIGRVVFCLHPHQTRFRVPADAVTVLPDEVPAGRAVLAANAETALNAIWDAAPKPGVRVLVIGAGLLGCLIAAFLSRRRDIEVTCTDVLPERSAIMGDFPVRFVAHGDELGEHNIVFHTSASASGLQAGIEALKFEGEVVELSWFGGNPVTLTLGGAFHSKRLTLRASQVGHVAAYRRASTSYGKRMQAALAHLADPRIDRLITGEVAFENLATALPDLLGDGAAGIATRITY